jgi:MOSC domain-containing protein YiiM
MAQVVATHVWPISAELPLPRDELLLDWGGPVGDRHHGETMLSNTRQRHVFERGTEIRNHRQLSLVDSAELADIAAHMGIDGISPGLIADNICTDGIPELTSLPRMTRMVFSSGAVIMLGGENNPCTIAGAMVGRVHGTSAEAFPKAAIHRRGVTGWVEHPGVIRIGDGITLHLP